MEIGKVSRRQAIVTLIALIVAAAVFFLLSNDRPIAPSAEPVPPKTDISATSPVRPASYHGDRDLPFKARLKYYRAQQKARHFFRTGSAKRNFDEAYPPGTFTEHVKKQITKSRLLLHGYKVRATIDELQAELDRIQEKSRRPDILKALQGACDNDIDIMRHCMAEPIVVDRKLREIFNQRQDEIQAERRSKIDGLRKGLTAEDFKKRSGETYREIAYSLKSGADSRERMMMPEKLREFLEKDLKQAGDISRLTIDGTAFRIYLLISRDEASMTVGLLEVRKLTYDEWVADGSRAFR